MVKMLVLTVASNCEKMLEANPSFDLSISYSLDFSNTSGLRLSFSSDGISLVFLHTKNYINKIERIQYK